MLFKFSLEHADVCKCEIQIQWNNMGMNFGQWTKSNVKEPEIQKKKKGK